MRLSSYSTWSALRARSSSGASGRKLARASEIITGLGYSLDRLYIVSVSPSLSLGRASTEDGSEREGLRRLLRFFKVPMTFGYLLRHSEAAAEDVIVSLKEITEHRMLEPFDGLPLRMTLDSAQWEWYRNLDESSPPMEVQLNITNRCVNRCQMCRKYEWPQLDMPVGMIEKIAGDMRAMYTRSIVLSGGEPLLHRNIDTVLDILAGMPVLILTSGTVPLPPERLRKIQKIQFSVDALDPEIYRAIRGPGNVRTVREGILRAREAGCDVSVTAVMQRSNILHVPDIVEFCEREKVPFYPSAVHSYDDLAFFDISKRPLPPLCVVPFYHCLIDPAGDVFVCCHHHEDNCNYEKIDRRFVLGNVSQGNFREIWSSERARGIKRELLNNRVSFCQGCYRYLLENDVASFIRSTREQKPMPYVHTYLFPLEIMPQCMVTHR